MNAEQAQRAVYFRILWLVVQRNSNTGADEEAAIRAQLDLLPTRLLNILASAYPAQCYGTREAGRRNRTGRRFKERDL
jgi:hypothetical protein